MDINEPLRTNFYIKWFDRQTKEVKREVIDGIINLKKGNFSNCSLLRKGVSELKIYYGKGVRVYYTKNKDNTLILLYGGDDKKHQTEDIKKAIAIKESLRRQI
ncbi:MAG: type II toxin-antitoxin system RelE/ParE family toxin [Endomicrobium sp.]|jgi:putative addiction module killer protein|nr:type II toxin-antitoxin system RelE/ParE family toxin [Endomicrobium sp.]